MAKSLMAAKNIQDGQLRACFFAETLWNLKLYMFSFILITFHEIWRKNGVYVMRYVKKNDKKYLFSSLTLTFDLEDDLGYEQKYHFRREHIHFSWNTCFVC